MDTRIESGTATLALDQVGRAFAQAVADDRVGVDGAAVEGLSSRRYTLSEVEGLLLTSGTPRDLVDQVWAHLVGLARADGAWRVVCLGLAAPSLRRIAARVIARSGLEPADVNSELVCAFLEALATVETDRPRVFERLRAAAEAALVRLVRADRGEAAVRERLALSIRPPQPCRHPDVVLARAVAAYVITPGEADLIGTTRLERVPVVVVATAAGVSLDAVYQRRYRAERRLVAWLTEPVTESPTEAAIVA